MQGNANLNSVEPPLAPQKQKDKDHIPDMTNDNHRKAVFHESKKKQSGIPDTLTDPRV
jgi:hypothetical protein